MDITLTGQVGSFACEYLSFLSFFLPLIIGIYNASVDMAPEVMSSNKYGTAADMFSFGLISYELFHGNHPLAHLFNNRYVGLSISQTNPTKNRQKTVPLLVPALVQYQGDDVSEKNFPSAVKRLIPRCCAHDQDSRATAEEALQLLAEDMQIDDNDEDGKDDDGKL